MSSRLVRRALIATAAASAVSLVAFGAGASAHVGIDKDEITAGASTTLTFSVGHGCAGSATNSMKFQIPSGVLNAQPLVKAGWTISTEQETLGEPIVNAHGEEQTERVGVITFTANDGSEIDNAFRDTFTLAFTAPNSAGTLAFKIVQGCVEGQNDWIEEWDGTGEEPEHPAPSVMVVAAAEGADDGHGSEGAAAEVTETSTVDVGATSDDDDGGSNGLAIAALVVGGLGLVAGGTALVRGRKPAA
jgi:uncharacterized protein YcnI